MLGKLHGAIAAAVTPLRDHGRSLEEASVGPLIRFLADGGVDGVLTCGTTGEGVLLSVAERRRMTELCLEARPPGFAVAVPAGAHDPLPFYIYEFIGRSGYPVPIPVIARLRDEVPNLAGLKVSDTPFEAVKPYLLDGLDVFIGFEPQVLEGLAAGAVGAVSGLASAWPEITAELVHQKSETADARVKALRDALHDLSLPAVAKQVLVEKGVLAHADVRSPLRGL